MQLRLVIILLLWFGYLDNDVGHIENWNIIYLLFLFFVFLLLLLLLFIYFFSFILIFSCYKVGQETGQNSSPETESLSL